MQGRCQSGGPFLEAVTVGCIDPQGPSPGVCAEAGTVFCQEHLAHYRDQKTAAAFALGREEVIPDMFRSLTGGMQARFPDRTSIFSDYLERHIALDGDHHSPMALAM